MLNLLRVLLLGLLVGLPAPSWSGSMTLLGVGKPSGAAVYVGPGDIQSAALNWGGLRAYNLAYATGSNPAAIVCDTATFLTCSTINILVSGDFDTATASGSTACAVACVVKQLYDQSGNAKHWTCASASACPTLTFSCYGSKPCMTCAAACSMTTGGGQSASAQPFSLSAVGKRTGSFTSAQIIVSSASSGNGLGWSNAANTARFYSPTSQNIGSVPDSNPHAFNIDANGASSAFYIDGASNAVSPGASGFSTGGQALVLGTSGFSENLTGNFVEVGRWGTAMGGTVQGQMNTNQHTYWGF